MDNDINVELNLPKDFPPSSWEEWKKAAIDTLKGVDFDKAMTTKTYEGILLAPIYRKEDIADLQFTKSVPGQAPYLRGNDPVRFTHEGWKVAQAQVNPDLKALNKQVLAELNRGLTALNLAKDQFGYGPRLTNPGDLETLFNDIDLIAAPLFMQLDIAELDAIPLLESYLMRHGYDLKNFSCGVGFDPTGEFAREGDLPMALEELWALVLKYAKWAVDKAPAWRCLSIDGTIYEAAGASSTQELAFVLSTAIGYIQGLQAAGLTIDQIAPLFQVKLALGSNFFMEIAKIRAFRLLWAEMIKAFGGSETSQKVWIHARTARFNKSQYDVYVNLLRTANEAFSGVIGGADSLEVAAFDELVCDACDFSGHLARNQQILLAEEAHFDKVIDPAGGCYYIESLTSELANQAWSLMQELEGSGGMIKSLKSGKIHEMIQVLAEARIEAADKRRDVFVGVNMFANTAEAATALLAKPKAIRQAAVKLDAGALPQRRAVQNLESLRSQIVASSANRKIFLLNIGCLADYKARAEFVSGFFPVGGFEIISGVGCSDVAEAVAAAKASNAAAFCIVSTDDNYPSLVPEICAELKGKPMILAGYPTDKIEDYKQAGIDIFIHLRANVYTTLRDLAIKMEVLS